MLKITPAQLVHICPSLPRVRSIALTDLLNELMPGYGMKTADQFHEFIATVAHESGEFVHKSENMNYHADRIAEVWPSRFKNAQEARPYAGNPERLANRVYGGRMGNGPEASGDGWKFRGGGFIMATGRDMFTRFARYKSVDVVTVASLVRSSDRWAMDSSLWIFCIEKSLLDEAERDEFLTITRAINGGVIGLAERKKYLARAIAVIR